MVGLPGLGKSTLVTFEELLYEKIDLPLFIYSTDNILERIANQLGKTYNDVFEKHIKSATAEADIALAYAIKERQDIIWDQTNLGVGKRRKIINRMKQAGYQVRCVCILPPESDYDSDKEDWVQRLANRPGKTIPQNILTNMIESFTVPTVAEGFDMITFYNNNEEWDLHLAWEEGRSQAA
jgi:heterogeneous nuclear ribonucleoprotein U